MNTNASFSKYYDNAIKFADFSNEHHDWYDEINRDGIQDILEYYNKTNEWYRSQKHN